jgi:hypothetical protein
MKAAAKKAKEKWRVAGGESGACWQRGISMATLRGMRRWRRLARIGAAADA